MMKFREDRIAELERLVKTEEGTDDIKNLVKQKDNEIQVQFHLMGYLAPDLGVSGLSFAFSLPPPQALSQRIEFLMNCEEKQESATVLELKHRIKELMSLERVKLNIAANATLAQVPWSRYHLVATT